MSGKMADQPPFTATDILRAGSAYLERFRKRGRIEWVAHLIALIAAYVAVIGSESLAAGSGRRAWVIIIAGLLGGLAEAIAWWLRRRNDRDFVTGRRLRRLAVATHGFDIEWQTEEPEDLHVMRVKGIEQGVSAEEYYASKSPGGWLRVLEDVKESAFFSWKLYQASSGLILVIVIAFFIAAALLCFVLYSQHDAEGGMALAAHVILIVSSFAAGSGLVDQYMRWKDAASECARAVFAADRLRDRQATLPAAQFQLGLLTLYSDYAAATLGVAPPPSWLYLRKREELTEMHAARSLEGLTPPRGLKASSRPEQPR